MDFESTVLSVAPVTHNVKRIMLTKHDDFSFVPGQYGLIEKKPFTFTSTPDDAHLEFTVKAVGEFSTKLTQMKPGDTVIISGPMGNKLNFTEDLENCVFIAGGSGITPFIAAFRYTSKRQLPHKFLLFYGNRTEKDIIYKEELESYSNLKVVHALSEKGEHVTKDLIEKHIKDEKHTWFVCGPPPMTAAMKEILKDIGAEDVRIEPWEI
ncbi:MAG: FAD-binding oxidoreductase [Candidatus Woesearchaeota archaeon]